MNNSAAAAHCIVYIGSEKNYFSNIIYRYKNTYGTMKWEFESIDVNSQTNGEALFLALIRIKPRIIYIDFCSRKDEIKK